MYTIKIVQSSKQQATSNINLPTRQHEATPILFEIKQQISALEVPGLQDDYHRMKLCSFFDSFSTPSDWRGGSSMLG